MIHLLQAVIMGFVQGLSEFLPVSSSAHLVFTSNFYKIMRGIETTGSGGEEVFLDIMLHLGTLIAVIIFFRKEILEIIVSFWYGIKTKDYGNYNFKLGVYIITGTIITFFAAISLKHTAKNLVNLPEFVGLLLILTGLLLLLSEHCSKKMNTKPTITFKDAIVIGVAQGLAILPGFSRSGLTISAGLFSGADREAAARYSFLLSIPVILGASMFYPMFNIDYTEFETFNWSAIVAGTIVSGITGFFCIKYFLKFVSRFSLNAFGYYCIAAGIATTMFFVIK